MKQDVHVHQILLLLDDLKLFQYKWACRLSGRVIKRISKQKKTSCLS